MIPCRLLETKVCKGAVRDWYQPGNLSWDRSYDKFLDQHVNTIALVKDGEGKLLDRRRSVENE